MIVAFLFSFHKDIIFFREWILIFFTMSYCCNFAHSMQALAPSKSSRPIATWLLIGVGMIIVQIILGGITRLTGSGLSITEWKVVTGSLPPMSEQAWMAEFNLYQQTPQFQLINSGFTLSDFKFIFFWEWFHRLWARLIGIVFLIPFVIFIIQKRFSREMIRPMMILFLLGGMQGAIGWIMVASGLTGDAVYVKPTRLALHFIFAMGLLCYTFWFALQLSVPKEAVKANPSLRRFSWTILFVLVIQLVYGAFMAGNKAANAAATWPGINGSWWPDNMLADRPAFLNFLENKITIHFIHRTLAYLLLALVIVWTVKALKEFNPTRLFLKTQWLPLLLVFVQVLLGIFSVLTSRQIIPNHWGSFEWMAQLHQIVAMLFLLCMVWMIYLTRNSKSIQ
jgi:heme a synthase